MIGIPAVCNNCNTIFPTHIFDGMEFTGTLIVSNSSTGPCPKCGESGQILDGTYKFFENVIKILSAPNRTFDELNRLSELIEKTRKEEITSEELKDKTLEETPGLRFILDWIVPKTQDQKFNISLVLLGAILNVLITAMLSNQPVHDMSPKTVINNMYQIQETNNYYPQNNHENQTTGINRPIKVEKIGRNQLCPCGSGLKYKRCHGE